MHRLFGNFVTGPGAVGLLIVRVVTGAAFMYHGWYKIRSEGGPFGWMPPEAGIPGFMQGLAVFAEFGGGLALILGLLTPVAALGIACTMIVALGKVHLPHGDPFVAGQPGKASYELAAVYLANVILLILIGPGIFSIDAVLFRRHGQSR
ncbi:MAG TPA: DoxX family protein [Gemmataceae bacterium]|nr:DoxX family protein [Gemmataceae bacterium]